MITIPCVLRYSFSQHSVSSALSTLRDIECSKHTHILCMLTLQNTPQTLCVFGTCPTHECLNIMSAYCYTPFPSYRGAYHACKSHLMHLKSAVLVAKQSGSQRAGERMRKKYMVSGIMLFGHDKLLANRLCFVYIESCRYESSQPVAARLNT